MITDFNTIPELMTPEELADFLRISKVSVYRLVNSRQITFFKIQGVLRFAKRDVMAFLESNCIEPVK